MIVSSSACVEEFEEVVEEPDVPAVPVVWEALPTDPFVCPVFGTIRHAVCHEAFLEAHSPDEPDSPCFRCRLGVKVRMATATGKKQAPEIVVDGGVSYHTEHRAGRGFERRIDAYLRWAGMADGIEIE